MCLKFFILFYDNDDDSIIIVSYDLIDEQLLYIIRFSLL